jgi:hypothetical protein
MSYFKEFRHFRRLFLKPRVFIFILTGVGFMFLTFLTNNNSLELGIAGIASIFIGIGVNNFTAIETGQKDELRLQRKTRQAIKTLIHVQEKIKKIQTLAEVNSGLIMAELVELNDYIELCVQYLEDV